ncbi:MAG: hypothetical protein JSR51_04775 [Proteobacteria bacterium]|nr:hypothetical protein [Pseudomonadota bacterium]
MLVRKNRAKNAIGNDRSAFWVSFQGNMAANAAVLKRFFDCGEAVKSSLFVIVAFLTLPNKQLTM